MNWNVIERIKDLEELDRLPNKTDGFVYIVGFKGFCKIGMSKNPYQRLRSLNIAIRMNFECDIENILISNPHINHRATEKMLLKHFSEFREIGSEYIKKDFKYIYENIPENIPSISISHLIREIEERKEITHLSEDAFNTKFSKLRNSRRIF